MYDKKVVESQIVFISFFKTNMDIASTTKRVRFHAETVSVWVYVCWDLMFCLDECGVLIWLRVFVIARVQKNCRFCFRLRSECVVVLVDNFCFALILSSSG